MVDCKNGGWLKKDAVIGWITRVSYHMGSLLIVI